MSRIRALAAWLPAVVLVPAALGASISLTRTDDGAADVVTEVGPLDPGTTWIYRVLDHGEPSGRRTRQVLGPSQLLTDDGLTEMTRLSSVYDDYPGRGAQSADSYLSVSKDELLQHGLILNGETIDITPPAPAYKLPVEKGTTWSYDGMVGSTPYAFEAEITDADLDVEVPGRTFTGCAELVSTIALADSKKGETEVLTEWTCPDIGVVKSRDQVERDDVDITEELVSFQGLEQSFVLGELPPGPSCADDCQGTVTAAGFDQQRSNAVPDGTLGRELAWSELRDEAAPHPPVSDGFTMVLGENDGTVSARDVASGRLLWQVDVTPPIVTTPAIAGDVVLVADADKTLWAFSLADGSTTWLHRFEDVVSAAPVVTGDLVVVPVEDSTLVGLDPADGHVEWVHDLGGRVRTPPALADDETVVVGDTSGTLTAVDADGETVWEAGLTEEVSIGPTVAGGRVLVMDGGVLAAYDVDDGSLRWQARGRGVASEALTATDRTVVTVTDSNRVEAFDVDDGELAWSTQLSSLEMAPAIVGDEVLVVSDLGRVSVLDLGSGHVKDSWDLPRFDRDTALDADTPLGLVGDTVVVTADTAGHYAEYAYPVTDTERPRGVAYSSRPFTFPIPVGVPPVLDADTMYALGYEGTLFRSTGPEIGTPLKAGLGTPVGLAASDGVVVTPSGEEVWGIDGSTGERLWKVPTAAAFIGTYPAIGGDVAFIPVREVGLLAVDLHTGERRWAATVDGTAGTSVPLPLPDGDVVYAGSGLTRYDGRTGDVVWALGEDRGVDLTDAVAYAPISADDDTVYAQLAYFDATSPTFETAEVVAADLSTGGVRWRHRVASGVFGVATVTGDGVVVTTDGANLVTGLDASTGEVLWTHQMTSSPGGSPVVTDGVVHLTERGRAEDLLERDFRVVTLDVRTGGFVGSYEPSSANDVVQMVVGPGPHGGLLVPSTEESGQTVGVLEVTR